MRVLMLVAMTMVVLAACGDDQSVDRARPTTSPPVEIDSPTTVEPAIPTTVLITVPIKVVNPAPSAPTTSARPSPSSTIPELTAPVTPPPGADDGLGDSIVVTDSVSIVVIDPEDA